jgi:hypothetical protein
LCPTYIVHYLYSMPVSTSQNGFRSKVWGPPLWVSLHCISLNFPTKPTPSHKLQYLTFFRSLRHVLPCKYCRTSYTQFTGLNGRAPLKYSTMKSRTSVARWLHHVHDLVNVRLKKGGTRLSFAAMCTRYERLRATHCSDSTDGHSCR